jgi:hypothetical protein
MSNLTEDTRIISDSIIENCAPLVRLDTIGHGKDERKILTLCHGSVNAFLMRHPGVLKNQNSARYVGNVEPRLFANLCLKYLQQPRYASQLKKTKESFVMHCGQDIAEHHLLVYCSKYWRHILKRLTSLLSCVRALSNLSNLSILQLACRSKAYSLMVSALLSIVHGSFYLAFC